jgi:SAM-dependent methyltransferase
MSDPDRGYRTFDHDLHARSMAADDYWGQVRRTVNGEPVPEEQIRMIVDAVRSGLLLDGTDALLDLACGNGALSARLFDSCSSFLGVDSSEYLVGVAVERFQRLPDYRFALADVAEYAAAEREPGVFTKVLCYGSFSYFPADRAATLLRLLRSRFARVERLFIGNLPDRERRAGFYVSSPPAPGEIDDPRSQIGIWRSKDEFRALARDCGWETECRVMPAAFFASHYRYDAILTPLA